MKSLSLVLALLAPLTASATIQITRFDRTGALEWTDDVIHAVTCRVESATTISGPWFVVPGLASIPSASTSQATVPILPDGHRFYRIALNRFDLANSETEFSGEQGQFRWQYGYYDGDGEIPYSTGDFELMTQFQNNIWMVASGVVWTELYQNGGHPNGVITSGGRTSINHWPVRRWVSEIAGRVQITGLIRDDNPNCGNSVTARILVDGAVAATYPVASGSSQNYSLEIPVQEGSLVDFAIDPLGDDTCDSTTFTAVIRLPQPLLADSVAQFSGVQGRDNWFYGYYNGGPAAVNFEPMTEFNGAAWFVDNDLYWTTLDAEGGHPNGTITSGGRTPVQHWPARRWVSPIGGPIEIQIDLSDRNPAAGNGIAGFVVIDGNSLPAFILNNGESKTLTYSANINQGSIVDFILDPRDNDDIGDSTTFAIKILVPQNP